MKLSRICLGDIENLADENSVNFVGRGYIKNSRLVLGRLKIKNLESTEILTLEGSWERSRDSFFGRVNDVLSERGLYLVDVGYRRSRMVNNGNSFHVLKGNFYKDESK